MFSRLIAFARTFWPADLPPPPVPLQESPIAMLGILAQIEKDMFDPEPQYPGKGKTSGSYWYNAETDEIEWAILHSIYFQVGEVVNDKYVFLGNIYGDFNETV